MRYVFDQNIAERVVVGVDAVTSGRKGRQAPPVTAIRSSAVVSPDARDDDLVGALAPDDILVTRDRNMLQHHRRALIAHSVAVAFLDDEDGTSEKIAGLFLWFENEIRAQLVGMPRPCSITARWSGIGAPRTIE